MQSGLGGQTTRRGVLFFRGLVVAPAVVLPAIAVLVWLAGRQETERPTPGTSYFDLLADRPVALPVGPGSEESGHTSVDGRAPGSAELDSRSGWFSVLLDGPPFPGTQFVSDIGPNNPPAVREGERPLTLSSRGMNVITRVRLFLRETGRARRIPTSREGGWSRGTPSSDRMPC